MSYVQATNEHSVEFLSLNEARQYTEGSLYVVNISSESQPPGGEVYITVPRDRGDSMSFTVPFTWLPQDLTDKAPRNLILESTYFMKAVGAGLLGIIDEETAKSILSDPSVPQEMARLREHQETVQAATARNGMGKKTTFTVVGHDEDEDDKAPQTQQRPRNPFPLKIQRPNQPSSIKMQEAGQGLLDAVSSHANVSAAFTRWVEDLNGQSQAEAAKSITGRSELSYDETAYLRDTIRHDKIRGWCAKQVEKAEATKS